MGNRGISSEGFARPVVRTWRFHAVAAALLAWEQWWPTMPPRMTTWRSPTRCRSIRGRQARPLLNSDEHLTAGRDSDHEEKFFFASFLFAHNLKIGLMALCLGVLAGVPTIYLMLLTACCWGR